jgi:DNA-binding transcriptional ArsR family regulator
LTIPGIRAIVRPMLNQPADIDRVLHALADPTRRQIVERLGLGPASVTAVAAPLPMSLPAVVQHLQVLEASGLVASEKVGRVRTCRLELERLDTVDTWISERRTTWERRLDRLGEVLADKEATKKAAKPANDRSEKEQR